MVDFSLVLCTKGRTAELAAFLASVARQDGVSLEVILVDQNDDERLKSIVATFESELKIRRLQSKPGLSHGRNVALRTVTGKYVGFPDDDCVYPPNLLSDVKRRFGERPDVDGWTGTAYLLDGSAPSWRFDRTGGAISPNNVFERAVSFTIFLKRDLVARAGEFDERLGVGAGTRWGSGEESDYLLRCLALGASLQYDTGIKVLHPAVAVDARWATVKKGFRYGRGMGFVLCRHGISRRGVAYRIARPAAGAALSMMRLRFWRTLYYVAVIAGRVVGYTDAHRHGSAVHDCPGEQPRRLLRHVD